MFVLLWVELGNGLVSRRGELIFARKRENVGSGVFRIWGGGCFRVVEGGVFVFWGDDGELIKPRLRASS